MLKDLIHHSPIISPENLASHLEEVKILDATFVLPGAHTDPKSAYDKQRIGEAGFFYIKDFADPDSSLPHMLPKPEVFAEKISRLGISNTDTVVVYGQHGMVMGPARAWWMFRVFGHDNVLVLDGGLPAWIADTLPLNTAPPEPIQKTGDFTARFCPSLVLNLEDMKKFSATESACILDARSAERFCGLSPEPRPGLRAGHIPGSLNVPTGLLLDSETGKMKSPQDIRALFQSRGVEFNKPIVTTCGSGVTACFLALALHKIGYKDIPVYDGSWSEWGLDHLNLPFATGNKENKK